MFGRVVDEQRRLGDLAHGRGDLGPVVLAHLAVAQLLQVHARLGGQQTHGDLVAAHLEREDDGRQVVLDRRRPGDVDAHGRLADGGPRGEDDHLARVQPVGQPVEVGEARRDADHALAAVAGRLDLVDGAADDVAEDQVVLRRPPLGDGVDLGLRVVDDLVDVAAVGAVAELDDAGAGLDQLAEHRPLAHDPRVVAGVRGGRDRRDERVQVRGAADALDLAALGQLVRDRDGVGRLAAAVQVDDRVVHDLVRRAVEVGAADLLDDVGDRVLARSSCRRARCARRRGPAAGSGRSRRHRRFGARRRAVLELLDRHLVPIIVVRTHVPWGV